MDRAAIDKMLKNGRPLSQVVAKYRLSLPSVKRHRLNHLGIYRGGTAGPVSILPPTNSEAAFKKWVERRKLDSPESVLEFARFCMFRLEGIMDRAEADGDLRTAVAAMNSTLKATTELFAKHVGLISDAIKIDASTKVFALLGEFPIEQLRGFVSAGLPTALIAKDIKNG